MLDVLWGWRSKITLVKTHCFDISRMLLPQDLCICSFCLLPGTAGLVPSLGQVCFKHHLNINSLFMFLPSFLIDLTLLYFPLLFEVGDRSSVPRWQSDILDLVAPENLSVVLMPKADLAHHRILESQSFSFKTL